MPHADPQPCHMALLQHSQRWESSSSTITSSQAPTSADLGCSWVVCVPPAPRMLVPTTDADLRLWISSAGHGGVQEQN